MPDKLETKIDEGNYTLYDKFIYGGLGYGTFCLPTNLFRIIFTVIFPPLGVFMGYIINTFPFVDFPKLIKNIDKIIYSFILTMLFYIPGLIYSLSIINFDELVNYNGFTGENGELRAWFEFINQLKT